jgi:DNA-binding SARP family transcriptional activator
VCIFPSGCCRANKRNQEGSACVLKILTQIFFAARVHQEGVVRLRVQALGGFSVVTRGGDALPIAASCRPILGYLLTHRHRRISRVELAETLWADQDGNHARRCLSTALWRLKKSTGAGPSILVFRGTDEVSFNWEAPAWVDSIAMELRLEPLLHIKPAALTPDEIRRLQRGIRLYRGDYLIGIDHEWAWLARQRLRNLYLDGLYHLTLAYAAVSGWSQVIEWGRRLSQDEPLREDVHRLLMRAHAMTGNRAKAIEQYRLCERLLRTDLGVEPMAETQDLYQSLLIASTGDGIATTPPLVPSAIETPFEHVRRRVARVRRALASSQIQLDRVLDDLKPADPAKTV